MSERVQRMTAQTFRGLADIQNIITYKVHHINIMETRFAEVAPLSMFKAAPYRAL
jgi:hypothetical protein